MYYVTFLQLQMPVTTWWPSWHLPLPLWRSSRCLSCPSTLHQLPSRTWYASPQLSQTDCQSQDGILLGRYDLSDLDRWPPLFLRLKNKQNTEEKPSQTTNFVLQYIYKTPLPKVFHMQNIPFVQSHQSIHNAKTKKNHWATFHPLSVLSSQIQACVRTTALLIS